ncbi:MAG: hypothetical protein ACRD3Z_00130 [Nitrososphaerales archaeon]
MRVKYIFTASFILLVSMFTLTNMVSAATLAFDKSDYTPFDRVTITLTDSSHNKKSEFVDNVQITVGGISSSQKLMLFETGANTGVFKADIRLSPDLSKFAGDMQVRRDDRITASFRIDADNVITETAAIEYHEGVASFDKNSYSITDEAKITVRDRDASRNPDGPDTLLVKIKSDTDPAGLTINMREVDNNSGTFEERLFLTIDDISSGNRLKVSEGDTISVRYTDNTLPDPAKLSGDGVITLDVKDIIATSVFGKQVPPLERAQASQPVLVDANGVSISQVFTGQQVVIQSEVLNSQNKKQPFVYIVQVKDSSDLTVSLSWIAAELPANDSLKVTQSWLPLTAGSYRVEIFVWESIDKPNALSPSRLMNVQVVQ